MSEAQGSRVGTMFGPYHLTRLLGRGGMGHVDKDQAGQIVDKIVERINNQ